MATEPRTISKADALAEAYKRGLLPPDKKAAYEEAQRRGLVGAVQPSQPAPQAAPRAQAPPPQAGTMPWDVAPYGGRDGEAFANLYQPRIRIGNTPPVFFPGESKGYANPIGTGYEMAPSTPWDRTPIPGSPELESVLEALPKAVKPPPIAIGSDAYWWLSPEEKEQKRDEERQAWRQYEEQSKADAEAAKAAEAKRLADAGPLDWMTAQEGDDFLAKTGKRIARAGASAVDVFPQTANFLLEAAPTPFALANMVAPDAFQVPTLPIPQPVNDAEATMDLVGTFGGYMVPGVGPGSAVTNTFRAGGQTLRGIGPVGKAAAAITPQGTSAAAKAGRYAGGLAKTVPETIVQAGVFGGIVGEPGQKVETAAQFATDPLNLLAQPILSLLYRSGIALKTMGGRVTPEAVQLQQAMQTLKSGNASSQQMQEAAQVIDRLAPRPSPTQAYRAMPQAEQRALVQAMQDAGMSADEIAATIRAGDTDQWRTTAPPPASQAGPQAPPAGQPSVSPVAQPTVTQGARGGAQTGATGAGQQAAGAVPPAGPATLQASPTVVPQSPKVAKDTNAVLRQFILDAGVPRNDVDRLIATLADDFETFQRSGSPVASRVGFGEFVDSNVRDTASRIGIQLSPDAERKLQVAIRGRGRAAHASDDGSKHNRQPEIMSKYIEDLRTTQKTWATEQIEAPDAFNKADISSQKDAIAKTAEDIGRQVYGNTLDLARDVWKGVEPPKPGDMEALTKLQDYMLRKPYLNNVPDYVKLRLAVDDVPLEDAIKADPAGMAHRIQSVLGRSASEASDPAMRSALGEARNRLLRELETALPGYKQARLDYGDEFATIKAFEFGRPFFADARRPADVADMAKDYAAMTTRQQTAARMSVRDEILGIFGMNAEDAAARLEILTRANTLNALEEVFGARGKRVADTLRRLRQESQWMTGDKTRGIMGVDIHSGSPTTPNAKLIERDAGSVRNGFQKAIAAAGDVSKLLIAIPADMALFVGTGGAYHVPMMTLGAVGGKAAKVFRDASPKKLSNATEGLFTVRKPAPANRLQAPPAPKRTRGPAKPAAPLPTDRRALLEAYEVAPTKRERERIRRALEGLNKPATGNKLKAPPPPPSKKPPPGTTSNASPTVTGIVAGGIGGAMLDQEDPARGAIIGATGLGTVAGLGNKLSKMGSGGKGPKAPPPKPAPVGAKPGKAPPPFKPVEGAEVIDTSGFGPEWFTGASKELNGLMQERRTATGARLAEIDREITSLRNALEMDGPPAQFADVPMASRFSQPVDIPWKKGSPESIAIEKAIADKRWTVQSVPRANVIPTQDSVFFDYAKSAGRYAGDEKLPIVVKQGDQYFVADGHHRMMAQTGQDQIRARVIDLAPPKPTGGTKPPPAQAGFGGGKGPPKPPAQSKPKNALNGIAGRAVAGGAIGAGVGSLAGDAQANNDLTGKISETEMTIAELKKALADFDKLDARAKQQFLKDAGFYAGKIDGNIMGMTTEGIERWTAKQEAAIAKAEAGLVDLVRRDAYQRNQPNPYMTALRDVGPSALGILALFGLKYMRGGAAKASVLQAEAQAGKLNQLITGVPKRGLTSLITKADTSRPANLNTLWQKGGASKSELPFKQDAVGNWKPNPKAKPADELFSDNGYWQAITKYVKGKDLALILGGGIDVGVAQLGIDSATKKLQEAEAEWKANPSDETFKRVEDAQNELAIYNAIQRFGGGLALGRVLGTFGNAYTKARPNIPLAATEQAAIKQFIAANKPPPKPRSPRKPTPPPTR